MSTMIAEVYDAFKAAGAPEDKALAAATVLAGFAPPEPVATKADVAALRSELKSDLTALKGELKADVAALKGELKADVAALKGELKADVAALKSDLADVKSELGARISIVEAKLGMIQWLMGSIGFGVLLLVLKSFWPMIAAAIK
jgi:hypothetical protein